jgi:hypothetical protein
MRIALRPLRHELKDGIIIVYGPDASAPDQRPAAPNK